MAAGLQAGLLAPGGGMPGARPWAPAGAAVARRSMSASANRIGLVHTRRCGAMALVLEDEARAYLLRIGYWRSVERLECGLAVEGVFGVFLAEAEPAAPDVDREVW